MTKHLYLMRHGETLFNQRRRIQGWCDSPLTEKGILQAKAASDYLKDIPFDHYYCSTAERSCDTLEIVTSGTVPYRRMKQLKERNFGTFEGESEDLNPRLIKGLSHDDIFPYYGGEDTKDVADRMYACLKEIMEQEDHSMVLAVSHAGAIICSLDTYVVSDYDIHKGGMPNCSILHTKYENGVFHFVEIIRPDLTGI